MSGNLRLGRVTEPGQVFCNPGSRPGDSGGDTGLGKKHLGSGCVSGGRANKIY